jgi:hypothetical protein
VATDVPTFSSATDAAIADWSPPDGMSIREAWQAGLVVIEDPSFSTSVNGETVSDWSKGARVTGTVDASDPTSIEEASPDRLEGLGDTPSESAGDRLVQFVKNRDSNDGGGSSGGAGNAVEAARSKVDDSPTVDVMGYEVPLLKAVAGGLVGLVVLATAGVSLGVIL